ncbi:MAG: hypothetical protein NDI61_13840 [Bdellovibrionaceae bacterium]|nr:hypothetical protein [Pseudobdellovibrionaceae bacterium]
MNRRILSVLIVSVFAISGLLLSACGGGSRDDARAEHQREREKLEGRYNKVRGLYVGTIESVGSVSGGDPGGASDTMQFQLSMYVDYKDDGVDPEGNAKFLPLLLGRFQLPDVIGENDREKLKADYDDLTGRVILTRAAGAVGANEFSMTGFVRGERIEGEVIRNGGVWGRFAAARTTNVPTAPSGGEDEDERRRRRRVFDRVVGTYDGIMESAGLDYAGRLTLLVAQRQMDGPSGKQIQLPVLTARFVRMPARASAQIYWNMSQVTLNSKSGAISMGSMDGEAARTTPGSGGMLFGEGKIDGDNVEIDFADVRAPLGRFRGRLVTPRPTVN